MQSERLTRRGCRPPHAMTAIATTPVIARAQPQASPARPPRSSSSSSSSSSGNRIVQNRSVTCLRPDVLVRTVQEAVPLPPSSRQQQEEEAAALLVVPSTLSAGAAPAPTTQHMDPVIDHQIQLKQHVAKLQLYNTCTAKASMLPEALQAAASIKTIINEAVLTKNGGLRSLQTSIAGSAGAVDGLIDIARGGRAVGYDALHVLCYRNAAACKLVLDRGVVSTIAEEMPTAGTVMQCAMCNLLTALSGFNQLTHGSIEASGLIPQLVSMCRQSCRLSYNREDTPAALKRLENRTSATLRNLTHNPEMHAALIHAGAVDALVQIMRGQSQLTECRTWEEHAQPSSGSPDAAQGVGVALSNTVDLSDGQVLPAEEPQDLRSRINAALSVAILVGHEENNERLRLDDELVTCLMDTLQAAIQGVMYLGVSWTVWKVCQGIANLTVCDKNKELILARGGLQLMAEVLFSKHYNNEVAQRYALSTLWNLAFDEASRDTMRGMPGLVDAMRSILATSESVATREVAKGALWTLGLEQELKQRYDGSAAAREAAAVARGSSGQRDGAAAAAGGAELVGHIMLSYEWGYQQHVLLIKSELERAGYQTWMDVDKMSGSTLEAMAKAVEDSAVVLVCLSKKYKESQACRTEAEYAFQQRKTIVPLLMETGYSPTGWLGALVGQRPTLNMSDTRSISSRVAVLFKELGDRGKLKEPPKPGGGDAGAGAATATAYAGATGSMSEEGVELWSCEEVGQWLESVECGRWAAAFLEQQVDGMALRGLLRTSVTDMRLALEMLGSELRVASLGQRLRLIEELARLFRYE